MPHRLFATLPLLTALVTCKGPQGNDVTAGLAPLSVTERSALLTSLGFDEDDSARVLSAFAITDTFGGDLGAVGELAVGLTTPPSEGVTLALARVETFAVLDNAPRARFVAPVTTAADGVLTVRGDVIARYLDEDVRITRAAGNQTGTYLLMAPPSGDGFALVTGNVLLGRSGSNASSSFFWPGATVGVSSTPLLATTGERGRYLTAALLSRPSSAYAIRTGAPAGGVSAPLGTAAGAVRLIGTGAVRQETEAQLAARAALMGDSALTSILTAQLDEATGRSETIADKIPLIEARLIFELPRASPAMPLTDERQPPSRPTPDAPAEDLPPVGHPTLRVDTETAPQVDLGCSGFDAKGNELQLGRGLIKATTRGWRARGDARYAYDFAATLFGAPENLGELYLDNIPGYCVVSTGEGQATRAYGDPAYLPGPEGRGMSSDISQSVLLPKAARSVQVRAAVFTQEFPHFLGAGVTDALYFRFDESPTPILHATLRDLAFGKDEVADPRCAAVDGTDLGKTCGAFRFVAPAMHGELWDIDKSTSAVPGGDAFGCGKSNSPDAKRRCFAGYLPPRVFCRDLDAERESGHMLTLRLGVIDGGDRLFDTALLVDSVVFSTKSCGDPAGRMTGE